MKYNQKHLTLCERIIIEQGLNKGLTFTAIATKLNKDPSTISKEIKKHRILKQRKNKNKIPRCKNEKDCKVSNLCADCHLFCKNCSKCRPICSKYEPKECGRLNKPPYVCNACSSLRSCPYYRFIYVAKYADDSYHELLSTSREGINQTPDDMQMLDHLVSPLILNGQTIAQIFASHSEELKKFNCSKRTLYKYIDMNLITVRNSDLPQKVKYKPRKSSKMSLNYNYKIGRTYDDFTNYIQKYPDTQVVEMDTVQGQKGGKVLLTLLFPNCSLMLAFLLQEKSQECVQVALDNLSNTLGVQRFKKLFPVILTDNGYEFQNPERIETNPSGMNRTKVYYCNTNCSWQNSMIKKNHEYIRYFVPKGKTFDAYTQADINLMINHINSAARDSLNGCTPYERSTQLLDNSLHKKLSLKKIAPDEVILSPKLLSH